MMARIKFVNDDLTGAIALAEKAVTASPNYPIAQYDLAQYLAVSGDVQGALLSLETVVNVDPRFWYLAKHEENFNSTREQVDALLSARLERERRRLLPQIQELKSMGEKAAWLSKQPANNLEICLIYTNKLKETGRQLGVFIREIETQQKFTAETQDVFELLNIFPNQLSSQLMNLARQAINTHGDLNETADRYILRKKEEESANTVGLGVVFVSVILLCLAAIGIGYVFATDTAYGLGSICLVVGILCLIALFCVGVPLLMNKFWPDKNWNAIYDAALTIKHLQQQGGYKRIIRELTEWLGQQSM